jgi:hypothetical protein
VKVLETRGDWEANLRREYPGVAFVETRDQPPGVNAVAAGVLVGRWYSVHQPPYGAVFDQPRSCGGRA